MLMPKYRYLFLIRFVLSVHLAFADENLSQSGEYFILMLMLIFKYILIYNLMSFHLSIKLWAKPVSWKLFALITYLLKDTLVTPRCVVAIFCHIWSCQHSFTHLFDPSWNFHWMKSLKNCLWLSFTYLQASLCILRTHQWYDSYVIKY